jgi:hypothetical protein
VSRQSRERFTDLARKWTVLTDELEQNQAALEKVDRKRGG